MTIFDAIRYPISIPPTFSELDNLPKDLWRKWITLSDWRRVFTDQYLYDKTTLTNEEMADWYSSNPWKAIDHQDIELLKQMIFEYNS